jgi:integrase
MLAKLKQLGVHPDFPLFPHAVGQWAKKVRGKLHYFGPLDKPQDALNLWNDQKDDLLAGRSPRAKGSGGGLAVRDLVNHFLTAKQQLMQSGELTSRSFQDYYDTCVRLSDAVGKTRAVSDLRPEDFDAYRASVAKDWSPVSLGNEIQRVRSLFKFGFDAGHLDVPVRFGPHFKKPKRREIRLARAEMPSRFLSAGEIRLLLAEAGPAMKAMILLGINCGWGNTDVAELQKRHLNLAASIADYPRPKTGIARRATLWAETVEAIKAAMKKRPAPKDAADADCVFITKYGWRWKRIESVRVEDADGGDGFRVRRSETDSVGLEFGKLLRSVKVKQGRRKVSLKKPGVNFYALRHTFRTVAGETGDMEAVDLIMGHEDAGEMGTAYREWEKDNREGNPRLRKVTEHVREWLYGTTM